MFGEMMLEEFEFFDGFGHDRIIRENGKRY
jgi:hypothetical protein